MTFSLINVMMILLELMDLLISINRRTFRIDHFTVVCLVAWPLNESGTGGDLVLIETSLLIFLCKFLVIGMRTTSLM